MSIRNAPKLDADSYLCNEGYSKVKFYDSETSHTSSAGTEVQKSLICN